MQFPVPQFTDVEDKIIGPLTIKQFGILFGVGIIVFLGFSATKNLIVTVFVFLIVGVPGLGLAFANINAGLCITASAILPNLLTVPRF